MLQKARPSDTTDDKLRILEDISSSCKTCTIFGARRIRFRVALPPESITFNEEVDLDLFCLDGRSTLHAVDNQKRLEGPQFTSTRWKRIAAEVGNVIQLSGIAIHNSIGIGELYHAPLRRIYEKLRHASPKLSQETALMLAVKSMNDI